MIVTLLDTKTGEAKEALQFDRDTWWWTEGNGSCDCNRRHVFPKNDGVRPCECKRYIAVDVRGDLEGWDKDELLDELNCEYPDELQQRRHQWPCK